VFCFPSTILANQIFKIPFARSGSLCGSFSYEGLFRQAIVYINRNRDTTWYGMIDAEWPEIRAAFDTWLDPWPRTNSIRPGCPHQGQRSVTSHYQEDS
jgi:hypothetical protein